MKNNIKFVDVKEKKIISTKNACEKVMDYIDECGKDSLKPKSDENRNSE
ncbi:hypothetical protein GOV14_06145 [Candidatus Pacearchaeota archaeon]|nr:hypothetical protein [Candidatus Pacearchaeota archaeon]